MPAENHQDLTALVARVAHYQTVLGLTDAGFCRRYKQYVGSPDVWARRLKGGDFSEIPAERWAARLRALIGEIEGVSEATEFYPELPFAAEFLRRFEALLGQRTDRRCLIALAVTGCGKTETAKEIARRVRAANGGDREFGAYKGVNLVPVQADESWRNNKFVCFNSLLRGLGQPDETRAGNAFITLRDSLKVRPATFLVDDAHEGGAALFKLVKTLIDQTASRFVLKAYPSSWRRLINSSANVWAEAQQLMGRSMKPIFDAYSAGTTHADLAYFFKRAAGTNGDSKALATKLLTLAHRHGNLRFAADVVLAARLESDDRGKPVDTDMLERWAYTLAGEGQPAEADAA